MAISSLTKFSVPLATNQSASNQGLLMPKLKYRFRVTFQNFGVDSNTVELTKQIKTAKRPSVGFEPITLDVYNSKINLLGKPKWENIDIVLRDDASGNVSRLIGGQIQKQFDFMEQASARSGIDYKFTTKLEMLDGGNGAFQANVLETWDMYGCLVTTLAWGETDYASNDTVDLTMTIMMDNAIQFPVGVGDNVGRTLGAVATG